MSSIAISKDATAADVAALRTYVMGAPGDSYKTLAAGTVALNVSHSNLKQRWWELKFDLHTTVIGVKQRIYKHCGSLVADMTLILRSGGTDICVLDDDSKMLGYYSPRSGMELHVVDKNPYSISAGGALENVNLVKKYRMSDEDYAKRKGTLRSWKEEQLRKDPNFTFAKYKKDQDAKNAAAKQKKMALMMQGKTPEEAAAIIEAMGTQPVAKPPTDISEASCKGIEVGMRCELNSGARRGTVRFVGELKDLTSKGGWWVGVELDEPVGKHTGTANGKQIFTCPDKHGMFVRGPLLKVGDYPELDDDDLWDDDDEL